jgi:PDZ domain-containing protein
MARPAIQAEAVVSSVIDTQNKMLTTAVPGVRAPAPIHRVWALPLVVIAFALVTLLLATSMLPGSLVAKNPSKVEAPYGLVPADAEQVAPRLSFDAVPRYPASAELLFVTIREPEISVLDWFVGKGQHEVQFLSHDDKFGVQTANQQQQFNQQMMRTAKETAEYVALTKLGYPTGIIEGDVIINNLVCLKASDDQTECEQFAPSDNLLDPGDKLLKVDGVELHIVDDLTSILAKHKPGDEISIDFDRPGVGERSGQVELIAAPDKSGRTIIGFVPFDTATAQLPFEVKIDSGAIGGPSAGLAFTLTLLDELTPGELTGGGRVAVTGTISIDGTVGAIGGLPSKASAVKQMGAKVFLVPASQSAEDLSAAREVAGSDLEIVPVATLDEALKALAERGGNGLDLGEPGKGFKPPA